MSLKKILSGVLGLPIVALILILGNKYIIDVILAIVAIIAIHEYTKCMENKVNPVKWIGYILAVLIAFLHIIPSNIIKDYLGLLVVSIIAILFIISIVTNMKKNIVDISVTLFGIGYIVAFTAFVALIYGIKDLRKILHMVFVYSNMGMRYIC